MDSSTGQGNSLELLSTSLAVTVCHDSRLLCNDKHAIVNHSSIFVFKVNKMIVSLKRPSQGKLKLAKTRVGKLK